MFNLVELSHDFSEAVYFRRATAVVNPKFVQFVIG